LRCEEVRELLPAYVDHDLHPAGEIEVHLASCPGCSAELASYRRLMSDLEGLRDRGEEPSPELLQRVVALIPAPSLVARVMETVQDHKLAVASLGGAAVGATAIAIVSIVWWRARRAVSEAS